ncbi:MAG TPA: HAMP domain-containing sensor histidine kinase, partial [bacterium]|nr:HAMP domain-containing sensor histidine kinase [bacterium]
LMNAGYLAYWEKTRISTHSHRELTRRAGNLLHVQMGGDFLLLTVMLYLGGGAGNPLVLFYLFHVAIAVAVFPPGESVFYVPLAVALPWLLSLLPPFASPAPSFVVGGGSLEPVRAFLWAYSAAAVGLWFFLSRLAQDIRAREGELKVQTLDLRTAKEGLEQLDLVKNRFFAQVAGRLEAPAQEIEDHFQRMEKQVPDSWPEGREMVREARRHGQALRSTVEDLLWISRLEAKDFALRKESIAAYAEALRCVQRLEPQARSKGVEFKLHGSDQVRLWADREGFDRVLDNLLSNAVKYGPAKGGTVTLDLEVKPDWLVVSVQDEGIGIAADQKKRVFGDFFRAPNAQAREKFGTGLGLAIVRRVLEWHGGKVEFSSHLKHGTRVETWWPLLPSVKGGMDLEVGVEGGRS